MQDRLCESPGAKLQILSCHDLVSLQAACAKHPLSCKAATDLIVLDIIIKRNLDGQVCQLSVFLGGVIIEDEGKL